MATTKPTFKKIRSVTLPVLKLVPKEERFILFIGPMHLGKTTGALKADDGDGSTPKKAKMEPATVAHCLDMSTGEEGVVICPAVMVNELNVNYPGETYVGRGFGVSLTKVPEKRYNIVTLSEVGVPDDIAAAGAAIRKALAEGAAKEAVAAKKK